MRDRLLCKVPSTGMAPGGELCRWLGTQVRFGLGESLTGLGLTRQQINEAIWQVGAIVGRGCGLDVAPAALSLNADIWGTATRIDGAGNILAQAWLPCPPRPPRGGLLQQEYDDSERWTFDLFVKVALHETLHSLGLGHSSDSRDIMYPSIGPETHLSLGPGDVKELQRRYGPPMQRPPKPDPKPPTPEAPSLPPPDGWYPLTERSGLFGSRFVGWVPTYREQPK